MARISIEINSKQAVKAIKAIEDALEKADVDVKKVEKDSKKAGKAIRSSFNGKLIAGFASAIAGISVARLAVGFVRIADEMTSVNARIRIVTKSTEEFNRVQEEVFQISQRTGTALATNANSYAKLRGSIEEIGGTTKETLDVVETLNKAFVINGSTTAEISSVMLQFAQAMGSGELRGEELRAVLEGNAFFARELAKALKTNIGGLRGMAEAGELTTKRLLKAFPTIKKSVDETFKDIPVTVNRAMTEVSNAFKRAIGIINDEQGTTNQLAKAFQELARAIEDNQESISSFVEGLVRVGTAAVKAFSLLSSSIGIFVGATLSVMSRFTQAFEVAFFTIKTLAQTTFATLAHSAADSIEPIIKALNKIPGVDIEVPTDTIKKLKEIEKPTEGIIDGIKRINKEYMVQREAIREQAKVYADAAKKAIKGAKDTLKGNKDVEKSQKEVAKEVADSIIVYDKVTGTFKNISSAAVESAAKQTKAWGQAKKSGVSAVQAIQGAVEELVGKEYVIRIKGEKVGGGGSGGSSNRTPSSGLSQPSASTRSKGTSQEVGININNVQTGESTRVVGNRQSVDTITRMFGQRARFASQ